ncbi:MULTISPECIES: hypothetical protein [unclassified Kitasatospora]|uniref:hypothetical protein n=1 Tax=unclassified Kitasatospora TaxID=2633591 RepID=UPI00070CF0FB|nr:MULTISPECIES: hypothetical protein [unclassified Kitasatospora]KQV09952.1 hypothetical protein ASC99_10535 [Kitasatospora sp. Root107]KRB70205.1 hypothetical protein ASE03_25885 [Kitasatospora sp. Root187]
MTVLLIGALVLAVGGCVCVVWADRGGPRWVQLVARATLGAGKLVRRAQRDRRRSLDQGDASGD